MQFVHFAPISPHEPQRNPDGALKFMELAACIKSGDFVDLEDSRVVDLLNTSFSYEIERLKKASPTIEASAAGHAAVPGTINGSLSPSMYLFKVEYAELNRSLLSVLALKWLLKGDFATFTRTQVPRMRLTETSFTQLRAAFLSALPSPEDLYDLIVSMIVSDVGKDKSLLDDLKRRNISIATTADHDEIIYAAAQHNILPSISNLPQARKDDILLGLEFGATVNVPQIVQAESVPASLEASLIMKGKTRAFSLKYLEIILDIAGAGAHEDARSAVRMIQPVFDTFYNAKFALEELFGGSISMRECYDKILRHRGQILVNEGFDKLSTDIPRERALLRLLAMGRVDNKDLANAFEQAFDHLTDDKRSRLVEGLTVDGLDDKVAIVPYYMPGLIAIGLRNTKDKSQAAKISVLESLFRLLSNVLEQPTAVDGSHRGPVERSVAFAQSVVASEDFRADPSVLDGLQPPLNGDN